MDEGGEVKGNSGQLGRLARFWMEKNHALRKNLLGEGGRRGKKEKSQRVENLIFYSTGRRAGKLS